MRTLVLEMLVLEVFRARPSAIIPRLVLLAKEIADSAHQGEFEDILEKVIFKKVRQFLKLSKIRFKISCSLEVFIRNILLH